MMAATTNKPATVVPTMTPKLLELWFEEGDGEIVQIVPLHNKFPAYL
jgi:hypothetical protein